MRQPVPGVYENTPEPKDVPMVAAVKGMIIEVIDRRARIIIPKIYNGNEWVNYLSDEALKITEEILKENEK